MKVPEQYYDEVFEFKGLWDVPSKCGIKTINYREKTHIIVTELYQDNPGTSVTYAGYSLFQQICERNGFAEAEVVYLECNPNTNSKLSFYNEEYYEVSFPEINGYNSRPLYRKLSVNEINTILTQ